MQIFCVARVQYNCGVGAGTRDICHWSPDTDTPTHCIHHCQGTSGPGLWELGARDTDSRAVLLYVLKTTSHAPRVAVGGRKIGL